MTAFDEDWLGLLEARPALPPDMGSFSSRTIEICGKHLETTPVFNAYWYFAAKRQSMFLRRVSGVNDLELPHDPVLSTFRFTNSYRASDRVSQYLIRNVIYRDDLPDDSENLLFRTLLFKLFNKIDTWNALESAFGNITIDAYNFDVFDELLSQRQDAGKRNYSAAYIMPSAGQNFGFRRKHSNHLKLLEWILENDFAKKLSASGSMSEGFHLLLSTPSLGPFLAYQFITDINYSTLTNFSEMEFVIAGPGALDGISKCFADTQGVAPARVIQHMAEHQSHYFEFYGLEFTDLWGRPLQLIDCQNIFCEISKYSRVAFPEISGRSRRSRIKQKYKPAGRLPQPWYPPQWGLNDKIGAQLGVP